MTCNQLMVLASFYRGSFKDDPHTGTLKDDLVYLLRQELICTVDNSNRIGITHSGEELVSVLLRLRLN